jgi:hypothetical protein
MRAGEPGLKENDRIDGVGHGVSLAEVIGAGSSEVGEGCAWIARRREWREVGF